MSKASHSFSVSIAAAEGLIEAILLQHFHFLQITHVNNSIDARKVWVRRSVKALVETYPYLTEKQIRGALERMADRGLICEEKSPEYDRTKGYQLSEKGWSYFEEQPFAEKANAFAKRANHLPKRANRFAQKGECYIGSYNKLVKVEVIEDAHEELQPEAENETPPPVAPTPPAGPGEAGPKRYGIDLEVAALNMKCDWRASEMFQRETRKPADQFAEAVDKFKNDQQALLSTYHNERDFRQHFFNTLRIKSSSASHHQQSSRQKPGIRQLGADPSKYQEQQAF